MEDESRFSALQLKSGSRLLQKIGFAAALAVLLAIASLVVQALLGDADLPGEGGLWHAVSQQTCRIVFWANECGATPVSTSTSTSTSTSLSVAR
jgi:hypothetical protein